MANKEGRDRENDNDMDTLNKTVNQLNAPYREVVGTFLYLVKKQVKRLGNTLMGERFTNQTEEL